MLQIHISECSCSCLFCIANSYSIVTPWKHGEPKAPKRLDVRNWWRDSTTSLFQSAVSRREVIAHQLFNRRHAMDVGLRGTPLLQLEIMARAALPLLCMLRKILRRQSPDRAETHQSPWSMGGGNSIFGQTTNKLVSDKRSQIEQKEMTSNDIITWFNNADPADALSVLAELDHSMFPEMPGKRGEHAL